MKRILTSFFLTCRIFFVTAQTDICTNGRPDTISIYHFTQHSILSSTITGAKPTSNSSFTTASFDLCWSPITQYNIEDFVARSLKGFEKGVKILDTLQCTIFGENYTGILFKSKKRYYSFFYQHKEGNQDFFIASKIKKKKVSDMLVFISSNLKE